MESLEPPRFADGDRIGVISPSFFLNGKDRQCDRRIESLKRFRFQVKGGMNVKLQRALVTDVFI